MTLLRLMSYNIRFNNPDDGGNAWPYRKDKVASMIRFHAPHVLGLQEALKEQLDYLMAHLPEYGYLGSGRDGGDQGEFCAILYRKDRLEPAASETFWLSETPDVPACKGWDAVCSRIVTWARFKDLRAGSSFYHFNTHIDHMGPVARRESVLQLTKTARALAASEPAVISGDFNFLESFASYEIMREHWQDAYYADKARNHGPEGTFFGFMVGAEAGIRIDYLFSNARVAVHRYATLSDSWAGRYPSDHLPVLAEVSLEHA